jgi:hypothetical protein
MMFLFYFIRDHQRKQNTLKALTQKALARNPDEFYFNMVKTKKRVSCALYSCNLFLPQSVTEPKVSMLP